MKKPVILITGGQAYDRQFHSASHVLNQSYTNAVIRAGGLPILALDYDEPEAYLEVADGLICSGTHEFSPFPGMLSQDEHEKRNVREHRMMRAFLKAEKPILGVCLGFQHLNVVLGGDLKRKFRLTDGVEHYMTVHPVCTEPDSLLYRLYGETFNINSYHTVRIDHLAPDLRATAYSPDGVIEAYEHRSLPVWGFQFHPERMQGDHPLPIDGPDMGKVFDVFVERCRTSMK